MDCVLMELDDNDVVAIRYQFKADGELHFFPVGRSLRSGRRRVLISRSDDSAEAIRAKQADILGGRSG